MENVVNIADVKEKKPRKRVAMPAVEDDTVTRNIGDITEAVAPTFMKKDAEKRDVAADTANKAAAEKEARKAKRAEAEAAKAAERKAKEDAKAERKVVKLSDKKKPAKKAAAKVALKVAPKKAAEKVAPKLNTLREAFPEYGDGFTLSRNRAIALRKLQEGPATILEVGIALYGKPGETKENPVDGVGMVLAGLAADLAPVGWGFKKVYNASNTLTYALDKLRRAKS